MGGYITILRQVTLLPQTNQREFFGLVVSKQEEQQKLSLESLVDRLLK
jgi:hypothetical protein